MPDVVVIGAGAFGAWTALVLREGGARVTLLDVYGPGNSRATSGDETRQIRIGYGNREPYSRWAKEAIGRVRATEYPHAEDFAARNILQPPSELQTLEAFSRAELA